MVMGGFILRDDQTPAFPVAFNDELKPNDFDFKTFPAAEKLELGKNCEAISELSRSISKDEIEDRSKGDALAKTLVLFQLTWFTTQIIARAIKHLPITALEITTVAYIVVSAILYILWWHKPKDVRYPVTVRLSKDADIRRYQGIQKSFDDGSTSDNDILEEFRNVFAFIAASGYRRDIRKSHQIPEYFSGELEDFIPIALCFAAELILGIVFGAIHSAAWFFEFPTHTERLIWRISALLVTFVPVLLIFLCFVTAALILCFEGDYLFVFCAAIGLPAYIVARFLLIAVTFSSLRDLPPDALRVLNWTTFIPHIG